MDGIEVTLTSDEVFALALIAFAAEKRDATDSALVVELVKAAIVLKNIELHMQASHSAPPTVMFGGNFKEAH
jgi:hypothetical protein